MQPAPPADVLGLRARLFTSGPRYGWMFRDRRQLARPFPQAPPDLHAMQEAANQRARSAHGRYRKVRKYWGMPSGIILIVLALADGCAANLSGGGPQYAAWFFDLILCGPGVAATALLYWKSREAAALASRTAQDHQRALAQWQGQAAAWQDAELASLGDADEWGSAVLPEGTRRADVFGGSLRGW